MSYLVFLADGDGLPSVDDFLSFELFDFVFDAFGPVEIFPLNSQSFVCLEEFDHFLDFVVVQILLVFDAAESSQQHR